MKIKKGKSMFLKSKYLSKILLSSLTLAFLSCDDGRIYEEEYVPDTSGKVMKLSAQISGFDTWARGYSVVLAGFEEGNEYAVITKPVPHPKEDNEKVEMIMSGIPNNVSNLQLCVVNRQRVLVHTYAKMKCDANATDTIRMENVVADVNMYDAVQQQVFNDVEYSCYRCHSGKSPAGNLQLVDGQSYSSLMHKKSGVDKDKNAIAPGDADASTLYLILGTELGKQCAYDHSNILINSYTDIALIKDWINNGAKEK